MAQAGRSFGGVQSGATTGLDDSAKIESARTAGQTRTRYSGSAANNPLYDIPSYSSVAANDPIYNTAPKGIRIKKPKDLMDKVALGGAFALAAAGSYVSADLSTLFITSAAMLVVAAFINPSKEKNPFEDLDF